LKALVDRLRALPAARRKAILAELSAEERAALLWCWADFFARQDERAKGSPEGRGQLPPPKPWRWWALMGGRAGGKTEAASRHVNALAQKHGDGLVVHLLGQTITDAAATMVHGVSGLIATAPPWCRPVYSETKEGGTLRWPTGARGRVFGAERARKGRGPQCNVMWIDDPAAFGEHGREVTEQLDLGFRLLLPDGEEPEGIISSTWADSAVMDWIREQGAIVYSRCETDDNRANLAASFFTSTMVQIAGTSLEAIERKGQDPTLLGTTRAFHDVVFARVEDVPEMFEVITISIDPADSSDTNRCEVGITAQGLLMSGDAVVLKDRSGHYTSEEWPDVAHELYEELEGRTARIRFIVEDNRGTKETALLKLCEIVRRLRRDDVGVASREIRTTTSRVTKAERAAPLVRLYKLGQVKHGPFLDEVEKQLRRLDATGRGRLDRADAVVQGLLDLFGLLDTRHTGPMVGGSAPTFAASGPRPLAAVAVGPMPRGEPMMSQPMPFQMAPAAWSGR
jgi:phage terminase large subunit-like protein